MKTHYGQMTKEELNGKALYAKKEHQEALQQMLFDLGFSWPMSSKDYINTEGESMYVFDEEKTVLLTSKNTLESLGITPVQWLQEPQQELIEIVEACGKVWPKSAMKEAACNKAQVIVRDVSIGEIIYNRLSSGRQSSQSFTREQFDACVKWMDKQPMKKIFPALKKGEYLDINKLSEQDRKDACEFYGVKGMFPFVVTQSDHYNTVEPCGKYKFDNMLKKEVFPLEQLEPGDWFDVSGLSDDEYKQVVEWMVDRGAVIGPLWHPIEEIDPDVTKALFINDQMIIDGAFSFRYHFLKNKLPLSLFFGAEEEQVDNMCGVCMEEDSDLDIWIDTTDHPATEWKVSTEYSLGEIFNLNGNEMEITGVQDKEIFKPKDKAISIAGIDVPMKESDTENYYYKQDNPLPETKWKAQTETFKPEDTAYNEYGDELTVYRTDSDKGVLCSDLKWYEPNELWIGEKAKIVKSLFDHQISYMDAMPENEGIDTDKETKQASWGYAVKLVDDFNIKEKQPEKPPLGVMPESIWKQLRIKELKAAVKRYDQAHMIPPDEWIAELDKLTACK